MNPKPAPRKERASFMFARETKGSVLLIMNHGVGSPDHIQESDISRITGSVLLIIFRSLISLCFITCLIRISFNLKKDQKNRPHDPQTNKVKQTITAISHAIMLTAVILFTRIIFSSA